LNNSPRRTGSEGLINVEYITQELTIENIKGIYQPFIQQEEPLKRELETFIDCIQQDKPQAVTGEDGLRALKICEEAIESERARATVFTFTVLHSFYILSYVLHAL